MFLASKHRALCTIFSLLFLPLLLVWNPVLGQRLHLQDKFKEELALKLLPNGDLLAILNFEQSTRTAKHHITFPASISSLAANNPFHSVEVHLTQGHWDQRKWGTAPVEIHPHGAEVIGWIDSKWNPEEIPMLWKNLTSDLGTVFCASLQSVSIPERVMFTVAGELPFPSQHSRIWAFLPKEPVCVENWTPWTKLLPCKGSKGVASIFKSQALFQGNFYGMHSRILKKEDEDTGENNELILSQRIEAIFKSSVLEKESEFRNLLLADKFSRCPVADTTLVLIDQTLPFTLNSKPVDLLKVSDLGLFHLYEDNENLKDEYFFFTNPSSKAPHQEAKHQKWISVQSYLSKPEGNEGNLIIEIKLPPMPTSNVPQSVCLIQSFPWTIRVWFQSLQLSVGNKEMDLQKTAQHLHFNFAEDRKAPSVVEICIKPVSSPIVLQVHFTKAFLRLEEHPPDAYRGVDLPAALIYFLNHTDQNQGARFGNFSWSLRDSVSPFCHKFYSVGTLVRILVPDFSMPYNVCSLTSTILAFYFCLILKLLTRQDIPEKSKKQENKRKQRMKIFLFFTLLLFLIFYFTFPSQFQSFHLFTGLPH